MFTFFGVVVLLLPYLLVGFFREKVRGVVYVFVCQATFQLVMALVLQFFHIFDYSVVISINVVIALACLVLGACKLREANKVPKARAFRSVDWLVVVAFAIIFFELFSVHYHYTGNVSTIGGIGYESNSSYEYPLLSDEWIAVSYVKDAINTKSLPLQNPLWPDIPVTNLMAPYFSGLANLFLVPDIQPIFGMAYAAIVSGMILCALIFLILRRLGCTKLGAVIVVLLIPFVANSGNLPGIWTLLPYIASTTFLLIAIYALVLAQDLSRDRWLAVLAGLISLVIYPPMIVFIAPLFVGWYARRWVNAKKVSAEASVSAGALLIRPNLEGGIPSYAIWNVFPWVLLPFMALGIWEIYKRKLFYILAPITVGLIFWVVYAYVMKVFIIEYPRIVIVTSLLLMIPAGFGIDRAFGYLGEKLHIEGGIVLNRILSIGVVVIFLLLSINYPILIGWDKFVLTASTPTGNRYATPAPLVNRYLIADDLKLFEGISGKRFIAPSWKGLVIGVATGNYPLESKASTLTNQILTYSDFMSADCDKKSQLAEKYMVGYVYSRPFECPGFALVGVSKETLHLYRVNDIIDR